jgi:hypothetical protein
MKAVDVEVIGVEPPCPRCFSTLRNVQVAASKLEVEGFEVKIAKLDVASRDTVAKYGVIMSPALAVNGTVKIMGRIPKAEEVETILREALK